MSHREPKKSSSYRPSRRRRSSSSSSSSSISVRKRSNSDSSSDKSRDRRRRRHRSRERRRSSSYDRDRRGHRRRHDRNDRSSKYDKDRSKSGSYSHRHSSSYHDKSSYIDNSAKESTSLMVRFVENEFLSPEVNETMILDAFSDFAQVKDIRFIKDKHQPEYFRNFVFVEYYTIDDAANVITTVKRNPMKINNERVYITFSKFKKDEQPSQQNPDGLYNVPDTSLQFNPMAYKTSLDEVEEFLKPNEILRSDQLVSTSRNINPAKTQEQIEKEKAEQEIKKLEAFEANKNKKESSVQKSQAFDFSGLFLAKNRYDNIINMGKQKSAEESQKAYNPADYVDIHVCVVWNRMFQSYPQLQIHWNQSELHKERMAKLDEKNRMNEVEMSD